MAPHSSTLAWKIPWAEEPDRLQSMGLQSRTQLSTSTSTEEWSINRFLLRVLHSQGIQLLFWLQGGHLEAEESSCRASWRHWYVNRTSSHPCGPLYLVTRVPARAETASLMPNSHSPILDFILVRMKNDVSLWWLLQWSASRLFSLFADFLGSLFP